MKKKLGLLLTLIATLGLTGCNKDLSLGSYTFRYVHIQMYSMDKPVHLLVDSWKNDGGGIELHTHNYGTILLGDGTYMMYDQVNCPICGNVEVR